MVSFEGVRPQAERLRGEERGLRFLPLYLAAVVAGIGLALGLTFVPSDSGENATPALPSVTFVPPATGPVEGPEFPRIVVPEDGPVVETLLAGVELPLEHAAAVAEALKGMPLTPPVPEAQAPAGAPAAAAPVYTAPAPKPASVPQTAPPPPAPVEKPNFYVPNVSGGGMTNLEQRLFDGINAERAAAGLGPYTYDATLSKVARTRSQQMADQDYFGHVDPYGYSMYTELLQRFGVRYAWAGENLALNNYSVSESPERAIISLMNSPSHRANLLAGDFYRIGIGEVSLPDGRHIYTMIFIG